MLELLRTKISIPPTSPRLVDRLRLQDLLAGGIQRALTLVVAPAGFGKTTLLTTWAQAAPLPVAWLSLDDSDRAPERFLNYLIHALQQSMPQAGGSAEALLRGGGTYSTEGVLHALVNDLAEIPEDFALVLDDYHAADSPKTAEIVQFLLENRPANFHLLIASRTTPHLNLARLRALDQVSEVSAADLRFTIDEIRTFLEQVMELTLEPEQLSRLNRSTEGWAVGLQLAAIAFVRQPDDWQIPAGQAQIFDFLAEEVLYRESPEIQSFLIRTALFDRFSVPLCEALFETGTPVANLMNYTERSNLFLIPLDASGTWYRYHALFADFLRQQIAKRLPEQIPSLYRKASLWFENNGIYEDAIHYAVRAEDYQRAADLIEATYQDLVQRGDQTTMLAWLSELPSELVEKRPRLLLARGWASIIAVDADQAADCAHHAAALIPVGDKEARLRGEANALRILAGIFHGQTVAEEDISEAFVLLSEQDTFLHSMLHFNLGLNSVLTGETRRALEAFKETIQLTGSLNNPLVTIIAQTQLGEVHQSRGELVQAERTFQQAIRYARETLGSNTVLQGMPYVSYAELLREQNRFEEAISYGEQGIAYCRIWQPMAGMDGYLALARLEAGRGNLEAADTRFEQALQTAERTSTPLDDTLVNLLRVRAFLLGGNLARAAQWMKTLHSGGATNMFYHFQEVAALVRMRFKVLHGELIDAELADLLPQVQRRERVTTHIEALILAAYAYSNAGEGDLALQYLNDALDMGARGGYVRLFVDEGKPLLEMLGKYRDEMDAPAAYLQEIREVMRSELLDTPRTTPRAASARGGLVSPTRRELDVLRLLADGKSNQQIADELVLALNTVKKHVANILDKLGVSNRTQAVMLAKEKGWIE